MLYALCVSVPLIRDVLIASSLQASCSEEVEIKDYLINIT